MAQMPVRVSVPKSPVQAYRHNAQQVKEWKQACISGADQISQRTERENKQVKQERKRIQALEKELRRKDRALAEAAALLVLSKKLDAFYKKLIGQPKNYRIN